MGMLEDLQKRAGFTNNSTPSGTPSASQVAGAPPVPSRPTTFLNPPSPASSPVGRPPAPPSAAFSGGAGSSLPLSGAGSPTSTPGSSGAKPGLQAPNAPRGSTPGDPTKKFAGGPVSAGAPPGAEPVFMDRVPSAMERAELPQGSKVMTPFGEIGPDGRLVTTPETEQRYREGMVQRQKKYGATPWSNDPMAPQPEVRLGGWSFNPWAPARQGWQR